MKIIKTLLCIVATTASIEIMASAPQALYHFDAQTQTHIFDIRPLLKAFASSNPVNAKQPQIKKENPEECIAIKFPSFASICKCPMHKLKYSSYIKAQ